ncbi:MAG: diguanylate cyclase [Nostocales cyanobacterium ELA583]
MNGYQVCQAFKADPELCDLPILFISALDETFDKIKAFQVGGVDYVTKPIQIEEVVARIDAHLTIQKQHRILQAEIANRRRFDDYLTLEWQRHQREKNLLSLIFIDIDYFKLYNDSYGYQGGDDCLIKMAQAIAQTIKRPTDLLARYGGEEFAVILPNTDSEGALIIAESIKEAIFNLAIPHQNSDVSSSVTLSMGIASEIPTGEQSLEILISHADQALYTAKNQGRNQAIAFAVASRKDSTS